jgi:hypothetical protein
MFQFLRTGTAYGIGTILVDVIVRQDFVDHVSMRLGVRKGILIRTAVSRRNRRSNGILDGALLSSGTRST